LPYDDLQVLFARLESLSKTLENVPLLELLAEFDLVLKPRARLQSVGIVESERYQRNLDHAYMLIDDAFKDGTISLWQVIQWLDLKSSTDFETDEPDVVSKADVLAITVHKAKGREFEAVLIPFTDSAFISDSRTNVSILNDGATRRVGWRWWRGQGKSGTQLDSNIDDDFTRRDDSETVREETRLLYVAMTRAKKKLAIFIDHPSNSSTPRRWADLLW
jgi:DNA helicase-2/ATP-dependent DNA helicase PcrA